MAGHIDLKNYNSFKVYPLDVGLRMAECGYPMDFFEQLHTLSAGALCGKVIEQYISTIICSDQRTTNSFSCLFFMEAE